jgi:hypothetical protein
MEVHCDFRWRNLGTTHALRTSSCWLPSRYDAPWFPWCSCWVSGQRRVTWIAKYGIADIHVSSTTNQYASRFPSSGYAPRLQTWYAPCWFPSSGNASWVSRIRVGQRITSTSYTNQTHHRIQFPHEAPSIDGIRPTPPKTPQFLSYNNHFSPAACAIPFRSASLPSLRHNRFRPFSWVPDWDLVCLVTCICLADSVTKMNERSQALSAMSADSASTGRMKSDS